MKRGIPFIPAAGGLVSVVDSIPVRYDPKVRTIASARHTAWGRYIAVGPTWFQLRPREREAVLYHELGHLRSWHLIKRWVAVPLFWTQWVRRLAVEQEYQADDYAAKHGYAMDFICVLMGYCRDGGEFYPLLQDRIERLKGWAC
jgi:Zn-dependent protease with chaperone function